MIKINNSLSTVIHLAAWLVFLPFLLFLLFQSTTDTDLIPNNSFDKMILAMIVGFVGVLNSGLLIPRLLYIKKIAQYLATVFTLLILAVILDMTLAINVSPVIDLVEQISLTRIAAIIAAVVISTSVRLIYDQSESFQ